MDVQGQGDDFLYPSNEDTTEQCLTLKEIDVPEAISFCATLSLVCYMYLFWMYFGLNSPVFKRHPTTLAIYKCLLEVLFVQQYLWLPYMKSSYFYRSGYDGTPYYCNSSSAAAFWSFVSQASLMGSELCFFIISLDMRLAYTNPFTSFKHNRTYFVAMVTVFSLATAVLLLFCGPQVYGVSELGLVWIQSRRVEQGEVSPNYPKFLFYYFPSTVIYIYCTWANFQVYRGGSSELSQTISNRWTIMKRSKRYTAGFVMYGIAVYLIEFISAIRNRRTGSYTDPIPSYFYALRGVWSLIIILYSNYGELTWDEVNPFKCSFNKPDLVANVAQERLLLQPHLNTALRAEILYFTTQGIMFAAKESGRRESARVAALASGSRSGGGDGNDVDGDAGGAEESRLFSFAQNGPRREMDTGDGVAARRSSIGRMSSAVMRRKSALDSQPNSSAIESKGDDGSEDAEPEPDRGTFMEIGRLQQLQNQAITQDYETAMREEVASLGANPLRLTASNAALRPARAGQDSAAIVRERNNFEYSNPIHDPSSSLVNSSLSPSGLPATNATKQMAHSSNRSIELIGPKTDGNTNVQTDSICSSDSTVRWNDSVDVEFGIRSSAHDTQSTVSRDSASSAPWRRIKDPTSGHLSPIAEGGSQQGSSNAGESVLRAIQSLFTNATTAAKNVFSPAYADFRFKDFCPKHFAAVRAMHNITAAEYAQSFETTCRERFSEGRSGAFMFYSSDQRCIVKTTTKEESDTLNSIMPVYVQFLESNPNSLLVRFLGSHCITMYGVEIYFVVMLNVFPTFQLSERYDLKGSWVNRHGFHGSPKTKQERKRREQTSSPLFQDNDLQNTIAIESEVAHALALQIRADVRFLQSHNFMDYSLLIGVRRERFRVVPNAHLYGGQSTHSVHGANLINPKSVDVSAFRPTDVLRPTIDDNAFVATPLESKENTEAMHPAPLNWRLVSTSGGDVLKRDSHGGIRAELVEGAGTYYIGIIDVLQKWNWTKRMERFLKIYCKLIDGEGLSAISPGRYCQRFWKRVVLDTFEGLSDLNEDVFAGNAFSEEGHQAAARVAPSPSVALEGAEAQAALRRQVEQHRELYARSMRKAEPGGAVVEV